MAKALRVLAVLPMLATGGLLSACNPFPCTAIGYLYSGPYLLDIRGVPVESIAVSICLPSECTPEPADFADGGWRFQPTQLRPPSDPPASLTVPSMLPAPTATDSVTEWSTATARIDPIQPKSVFIQIVKKADRTVLLSERRVIDYNEAPTQNGCLAGPATPKSVLVDLALKS